MNNGVSGSTLLQTMFIGLKLTGYITWSWFWVLAPLWMTASFALTMYILVAVIEAKAPRQKRKNFYY